MPLSDSERERYLRQLLVENWNQEKLKSARVAIIGLGGLGGISATYLAAAGVGYIRIVDSDKIELSNLNRQILFSDADIGKPKIGVAVKKLYNPEINIEAIDKCLTVDNAAEIVSGCDLLIDGLDNHEGRLILNKVSVELNIPFIYGAIDEWQGQTSFIKTPESACLACLMPAIQSRPKPVPVFGALPGVIGAMQATLGIHYLMTGKSPLLGRLLIYYADRMNVETVSYEKNPDCPVCGK